MTRWTGVRRRSAIGLTTAAMLTGGAAPAHAHAFAQRYDLPVPLLMYLSGAGAVVALSFLLAAFLLRRGSAGADYPRLDLLRWRLGRAIAHPLFLNLWRIVAVAIFALILVTAFTGTEDPFRNIAPVLIWVIWWIGMAYVSALAGDLWSLLNPWSILFGWTEAAVRKLGLGGGLSFRLAYPERLGVWPAVILFFCYAWIELIWHGREVPANLGLLVVGYSVLVWGGMVLFGRQQWLARGEAFTVLFGLLARFAPIETRTAEGASVFNLRPPAAGLLSREPASWPMTVFVLVLLSTVTFDGVTETPAWTGFIDAILDTPVISAVLFDIHVLTGDAMASVSTLALVVFPLTFFGTYLLFSHLIMRAARVGGAASPSTGEMARAFILTLVPIAIAYHLAHYLSFFLVAGQLIIPLASDPLGIGWDLFGTTTYFLDVTIVGTEFVWVTSIVAIVIGHMVAVYLAHVTALRIMPDRHAARRSQYPMLVLMVGYTMISLWILAQPVVEYKGG